MNERQSSIKCRLIKLVERARSQCLDKLAQHDLDELIGHGVTEGFPETRTMTFQVGRRRKTFVVVRVRLADARRCFSQPTNFLHDGGYPRNVARPRVFIVQRINADRTAFRGFHCDIGCLLSRDMGLHIPPPLRPLTVVQTARWRDDRLRFVGWKIGPISASLPEAEGPPLPTNGGFIRNTATM